jgi:chromosome segregation ATPase
MSEALFSSEAETETVHGDDHTEEGETLAVSAVDFSALEERVLRTVELLRRERQARSEAEDRIAHAEAQIKEQNARIEQFERDVKQLHGERDHVRERVEKLLKQLDTIEL